jgi:SprT protein
MLTKAMQDRVTVKIIDCIKRFYDKTGFAFNRPPVKYDLKGGGAGEACYNSNKSADYAYIRLNPVIYADHEDDFIERTVPHEMAHLLAFFYYKSRNYRITPHGKEWQNVMRILGVKDVTRCHSYSVRPEERKRQSKYAYKCSCTTFEISTTRHNKMLKGKTYHCIKCHQPIVYSGPMI